MTRKSKILLAGALAGLLGTVAVVGAVQADNERGYGPGPGRMMDERGGPRGDDDDRGGWMRHAGWSGHHGGWGGHHGGFGPGGMGRGGFGPGADMMRHMFELADADKDGKLTQAEIDKARDERFEKYDADKNGKLSLEEFDNLFREITRPMMVRAFQHIDPDGDAAVTKDEIAARSKGLVERFDRNGDGALSIDDHQKPRWGWGRWGSDKDDDRK